MGFQKDFVEEVINHLSVMEKKMEIDLNEASIEVKIISSTDGASHLVGPFFSIYYRENPEKTTPELMESNKKKLMKDWDRKMV